MSGAAIQRKGLKEAMNAGLVKVTATSTGAVYHNKALKLQIVNTSREALQLTVDPALIFRPDDTAYQDLVLPGRETIVLTSGNAADLTVQTFCGRMSALAPGKALVYRYARQGDSTMIKVLQHISAHHLTDAFGQSAVWALTDRHNLEGVVDPARPKESADLFALMVKLTGWKTPEYFKMYRLDTVAGQPVFRKRLLKIVANLDWRLEESKKLTLGIFNQTGDLVQGVLEEKEMKRGIYKMQVQFEAEGAPPGKYYMRLREGDRIMKEIRVVVD